MTCDEFWWTSMKIMGLNSLYWRVVTYYVEKSLKSRLVDVLWITQSDFVHLHCTWTEHSCFHYASMFHLSSSHSSGPFIPSPASQHCVQSWIWRVPESSTFKTLFCFNRLNRVLETTEMINCLYDCHYVYYDYPWEKKMRNKCCLKPEFLPPICMLTWHPELKNSSIATVVVLSTLCTLTQVEGLGCVSRSRIHTRLSFQL